MKINVNLPSRIEVNDYHEFDYLELYLKEIIPGVKVKEIDFVNGKYTGVAYVGKRTDPETDALVKKIRAEVKTEAKAEEED